MTESVVDFTIVYARLAKFERQNRRLTAGLVAVALGLAFGLVAQTAQAWMWANMMPGLFAYRQARAPQEKSLVLLAEPFGMLGNKCPPGTLGGSAGYLYEASDPATGELTVYPRKGTGSSVEDVCWKQRGEEIWVQYLGRPQWQIYPMDNQVILSTRYMNWQRSLQRRGKQ